MKKLFLSLAVLLSGMSAHAVDYLVQTGAEGAATWAESVVTATGATVVDLTKEGTTIDAWITANAAGKESWLAAGTYTFAASATNGTGVVLYGGFAGTETAIADRAKGDQAWEFTNATVLDANGVQAFKGSGQKQLFDGITIKNSTNAGNAGIMRLYANSTLENCQFVGNKATTAGGQGGAIQVYNASVTIKNCLFEGNEGGQGGALFLNTNAESTVSGCYFKDNFVHSASTAANSGGAVHLQGTGKIRVDGCYFTGNHVDNSKNGAAISIANSNAETSVTNCVFYANDCDKPAVFSQGEGLFANNTVVENQGGAIYATKGVYKNNVFWATEKEKASMGLNSAAISFVNNASVVEVGGSTVVENTILLEMLNSGETEGANYPYFVDVEKGDFMIADAKSALIDKGAADVVAYDYRGYERPAGEGIDLGAYEYGAKAPAKSFTLTVSVSNGGSLYTDAEMTVVAENEYSVVEGETMTFYAKADDMYALSSVLYNGEALTATDGIITTPAMTADSRLEVSFEAVVVSLTVESNYLNLLTVNEEAAVGLYENMTPGTKMTFHYTLPDYYTLVSVFYNEINMTASCLEGVIETPAIEDNSTLKVTFEYREPLVDPTSKVVYVKVGGEGDGSTWGTAMGDIAAALKEAKHDRENPKNIWVAAGTYLIDEQIVLQDSVNIYGGFAGTEKSLEERAKGENPWEYKNATILDGQDKTNIMAATKNMDSPIEVEGFTFLNGHASTAANTNGGAIRLSHNVTLKNSIAKNCYSNNAAGAVQIYPAGDVYNCYFEGNRQEDGANGGGAINGNTSSNGFEITIAGCVFVGNSSAIRGGAINIQGQTPSYIYGCTFYNNMAVEADGVTMKPGAAIYDNSANQTIITNNVIYNNMGGSVVYSKPKYFANNTIVKNVGGYYLAAGTSSSEVINNIVWACATDGTGTTPTSISGVAVTDLKMMYNFTYNPIPEDKGWILTDKEEGNSNMQFASNQTNGDFTVPEDAEEGKFDGKILSGPKLRKVASFIGALPEGLSAEDAAVFLAELDSVDLHLNAASPCVNAGYDLEYVQEDKDGASRPQGLKTDAGAYELSYYTIVIDEYDEEAGLIYDELGEELHAGASLDIIHGGNIILYFLGNEGNPEKVTKTLSTDQGLTYEGEEVDITSELDADGRWEAKIYENMLISVSWKTKQEEGFENVNEPVNVSKSLMNGMIVIRRAENVYNVLGARL